MRLAEKAKPKGEQDGNLIAALKLCSNGVYGKSNEITSWLYDPLYTMRTTINGQLLLTMLAEQLVIQIPNLQLIQINTDGITVKIERDYEQLYYEICKQFETKSRLTLEFVDYSKMVIMDVNNYLSIKSDGKVKYKGLFEIQKELHKNNSMLVVPKALSEYYINNFDYKEYVKNVASVQDFCKGVKVKSNFDLNLHSVKNREHIIEKGEKVTRYYVSTDGGNLCKEFRDGGKTDCESGWKTTIMQTLKPVDNIDYTYYIKEVEKIVFAIEGNKLQTTLF